MTRTGPNTETQIREPHSRPSTTVRETSLRDLPNRRWPPPNQQLQPAAYQAGTIHPARTLAALIHRDTMVLATCHLLCLTPAPSRAINWIRERSHPARPADCVSRVLAVTSIRCNTLKHLASTGCNLDHATLSHFMSLRCRATQAGAGIILAPPPLLLTLVPGRS
eukprot:COSAG01_NODE_31025_length_605_cov_0.909091_1_plen_164_part_10